MQAASQPAAAPTAWTAQQAAEAPTPVPVAGQPPVPVPVPVPVPAAATTEPQPGAQPTDTQQEYTSTAPSYATASLYIGDLHEDVTEPVLYEVFSQPASVASIRICRDSSSQRSLGYGYVNYHTIPDAERAMDVLNFTNIKGRPCRIMWANRDKATRFKAENNVFVKNLDRNIDNKSLYDTFSLFGQIVSCKVATDSNGRSLGYGYVQYEKEQSLIDAIKRVNGMQIGNNTVYCGRHKRKDERVSLREEKFTNVYVKGYDSTKTPTDDMKELFATLGEVTSYYTKVDDKGRESLFVNYQGFDAAKTAIKDLNGRRFDQDGKLLTVEETEEADEADSKARENGTYPEDKPAPARLYVTRHQSRAERDERLKQAYAPKPVPTTEPQPTVLYTRHFPVHFTDDDLKALFETYGMVNSAKVAVDEHGNSRGFGFVTFPEGQDAQKAITGLHETIVPGSEASATGAKLYVAYLEPKETRQTRLKAQIAENMWRPNYATQPRQQNFQVSSQAAPAQPSYPSVLPGHRMNNQFNQMRPNQGARPAATGPRNQGGPRAPRMAAYDQSAMNTQTESQIFSENIAGLNFKEQKQAIGDRLYHVIMARQPALAGKITGMMLEMPNEDLLNLLQRPDELAVKIDEAIEVLKAAGGNQL